MWISHVIGKCTFNESTFITPGAGILEKLYRPWLKAEILDNLLFVNLVKEDGDRK